MTNEEILKAQNIVRYKRYFIEAMNAAREDETASLQAELETAKKELKRVKGLLEKEFRKGFFDVDRKDREDADKQWHQYKTENNL